MLHQVSSKVRGRSAHVGATFRANFTSDIGSLPADPSIDLLGAANRADHDNARIRGHAPPAMAELGASSRHCVAAAEFLLHAL